MFRADFVYSGVPAWDLWGEQKYITYYAKAHVWVNSNTLGELWRLGTKFAKPDIVPEKKIDMPEGLSGKGTVYTSSKSGAMRDKNNRRFKLINVEESINELRVNNPESRCWPHLGLLFVGTVADQEGWDVTLHDELVEGYVNMERFVQSGDIVGLSLVITGMDRGIELARQAKRLGASYVIAGNDSASFRARQVLELPDRPVDAVFTTNSLTAVRQFLRQVDTVPLHSMRISGVAVVPTGVNPSNERSVIDASRIMRAQLAKVEQYDPQDVFVVPNLGLYSDAYWEKVWHNYRTVFGHKHKRPAEVKNALALFAQGCTRVAGGNACTYCTIMGVDDVRVPTIEYLRQTLEAYQSFGIDYVFNATDSVFEMGRVVRELKDLKAFFSEGLMIYGRAHGLAHHPKLIDEWLSLTGGRLLVNVGLDSGDERMLRLGVNKASQAGSRLEENRQAIRNLASSGAHLHSSYIFGSPGETRESCEKTLEFFEWTRAILGTQLDQCETDIFWLNHGSPASRVFHSYEYAVEQASLAGKAISLATWEEKFHRHCDTLVVPWESEEAWYDCFTSITVEEAQKCNAYVATVMAQHEGSSPGRAYMGRTAFKPTK